MLPKAATLGSYFIVLGAFLLITLVLTLHTPFISGLKEVAHSEDEANPSRSILSKERISILIESLHKTIHELWAIAKLRLSRVVRYLSDAGETARELTDKKFFLPFCIISVLVFWFLRALITKTAVAIYFLIWELPGDELIYDLNLLRRPRSSDLYPVRFSYRKYFLDVLRFLFLPVWLTLVFFQVCLIFIYWISSKCWVLIRKVF